MYNLIKFEFYKLKHNRVFKNSLILISLCVAYTIYLFFLRNIRIRYLTLLLEEENMDFG